VLFRELNKDAERKIELINVTKDAERKIEKKEKNAERNS
jgi:hypothetical protein